jgi:ATP/maltotriose-dependent transcriptional regulator MalT
VTIETPSPVITTKLVAPRVGSGTIDRPRLFQLVSAAPSARLVLITAPAGFGKTSFAAAWFARLRAAGHRAGWLTIDPEDDQPARFLHCVARALLRAADSIDPSAVGLSTETSLVAPQAIVSAMVNQLADIDDELYLVLDDFHWLTDRAIHEAVSLLVTHAPPNFHLILTTRQLPPLPLARLRANGELLEIDAAALRFDADETSHFLQQACAGRLAAAAISRLHASTEGWAAALRLAAAGIVQGGASADASALGPTRPFAAYLEEMLASWPDETVDFMTRASVLDSLSCELCRAVTGEPTSGELLESVARRHLLLEPVDSEGQWYRFHGLLLDYLRQRLQTRHADEVPELHRRAFAWYAEREMWTDAARHAIAAGDTEHALEWISRCGMTLVKRGDLLTLLGWQHQFPAELMRGQVKLRLAIAWGMALAMRVDEAGAMLEQIEQDARAQAAGQEQADVLLECEALRAVTLVMSDDSTSALALAEACIARPSADPWDSNVQSNVLRFARWKAGDVDGVYAAPWIPYSLEQDRRNVFSSVYRHCLLGLLALDQARLDLAERDAREAMRLAEEHVGPHSTPAAIGAPLLADVLYEQGRFDEVEDLLVERMPMIDAVVMLEGVRRSYVVLARIEASRSALERAYGLLAQAESVGYNRKWDRLVSGVLLERTRLHLLEGRLGEASACVVRLERLAALNPVVAPCARSEIHRDLDLARVELACSHDRWAEAVGILEELHRDAQAVRNARLMMQLKARAAIVLMASNDADAALLALRAALDIAAPAGAYRSVLDAGPDIAPLLGRFRASSRCTKALEPCVERLLAGCKDAAPAKSDRAGAVASSLSPREQEILTLIAEGRSNKEVARALGVTPETVKTHLKNVFEKLSVERRAQAVARARSLGLL